MSEPHDPENSTQRLPTVESGDDGGVLATEQSASGSSYEPTAAPDRPGGRAGRFWAQRRIPAVLVALVVLGGAGILLYDIVAVRAGRPAMQWRRTLADDLASRHLDDVWVLTGSAVAAALGLWLLLLALTPGLRALLPMRRDHAGVRAGLDRKAAAMVLRDRAVEVPGVQSVRVKMKRRKATVRAQSHFRELDDIRTDLDTVLGQAVRDLGLARQPGLSVRVRRPAKKG
ncbi:DUF6286 domain-containing protein [Streptomyces sp. NPDC057428]|uniref:DUF6286 domain-containing protein n=1 Tax=Streptomyces sp. NPDC057428 TaxID=3346129 RepID=UPI0036CAA285